MELKNIDFVIKDLKITLSKLEIQANQKGFSHLKKEAKKRIPEYEKAISILEKVSFCECGSEKEYDSKYCISCNKFHSI